MTTFNPETARKVLDKGTTLFWFRRDLRLADNAGLFHALKENTSVLPLFIFDKEILDKLEDKADSRVGFIHHSLLRLKEELEQLGSSLLVLYGNPVKILSELQAKAVYTNRDYDPYAIVRDKTVEAQLTARNISFHSYKDQVIFEQDEVIKDDGTPYTVFTPYSRKWKSTLNPFYLKPYPTRKYFSHLKQVSALPFPALNEIGFKKSSIEFPERIVKMSIIQHYDRQRDFPGIAGTTRLSVHLRFGTVSIRALVKIAKQKNEGWLNELIWREFYQMILWHFPSVERSFKPAYDQIKWRNDPDEFSAWCNGKTGYPIVDAGMRELNKTGFMHNRVRMIVASFLTKHLLIDWRWGEAYFAEKLLDFDLASNNGGWQWAAGCGCDAAPYFRVFNPYIQTEKFDAERTYIRKWVPEFESKEYPKPIVDHAVARERVLRVYKSALG